MKCIRCGQEMYSVASGGSNTVCGSGVNTKYVCPKCGYEVSENFNNIVERAPVFQPNYSVTNYGWICPKCGAVLSPSTKECPYCTPYKVTCGPVSGFPIKSVLTSDVPSQAQVYSPQKLMESITLTSNSDLRVKEKMKEKENETN